MGSLSLACGKPGGLNIPAFTKQVDVFGITIYATANAPDHKMLHAANVLAEFLDNDGDGMPDNQLVMNALLEKNAILIMTKDAGQEWELIHPDLHYMFPDAIYHDNFADEANPDAIVDGTFDGLWEETLHLITRHGYGDAYPAVFGLTPGTEVALAVDAARGGHFVGIPEKYPEEAWYTYYDETCGYGCQIDEYVYWALTSMLGVQDLPGRSEDISDEWRLNTLEKVRQYDPAIYTLLSKPEYKFPTTIPHGDYSAKKFEIEECFIEVKVQRENSFPPEGRYPATVLFITECQTSGGEGTKISFTISEESEYKGRKLCLVTDTQHEPNSELLTVVSDIKPELRNLETLSYLDIKSVKGANVWLTTEPMVGSAGAIFPRIVKIETIDD